MAAVPRQRLSCLGEKITGIARGNPVFLEGDPAEFVIPYDRQALADDLGEERSAMSAEISKLKKAGRIECDGFRFRMLTPDKESS